MVVEAEDEELGSTAAIVVEPVTVAEEDSDEASDGSLLGDLCRYLANLRYSIGLLLVRLHTQ